MDSQSDVLYNDSALSKSQDMSRKGEIDFQLPKPLANDMRDEWGHIEEISNEKKATLQVAVISICKELDGALHIPFKRAMKKRFSVFVKAQVRGNMYPLIASLPKDSDYKDYAKKYRETYNRESDADFMICMRDRFSKVKRRAENDDIPLGTLEADDVRLKLADEAFQSMERDHKSEEALRQTSNNNCWYLDYILDKVLTKAHNIAVCNNMKEKSDKQDHKIQDIYKDLNGMTLETLLEKIQTEKDTDSIVNLIDIKLSKMAPIIKTEMILAATSFAAPTHLQNILKHRLKRLGLNEAQLTSARKLYFVTIAAYESTMKKLLEGYSIVAASRVQAEHLCRIHYDQVIVCLPCREQYESLLARHMTLYAGYKMIAVKTFPDEEDDQKQSEVKTRLVEAAPQTNQTVIQDWTRDEFTEW